MKSSSLVKSARHVEGSTLLHCVTVTGVQSSREHAIEQERPSQKFEVVLDI